MSDEQKAPEPWSVERWEELEQLARLLYDCGTINRGNYVIEKLQHIIKDSESLTNWTEGGQRQSFLDFIREQARHGYRPTQEQPK